jgi:hypothetical protein
MMESTVQPDEKETNVSEEHKLEANMKEAYFLRGLLFCSEDKNDSFLRNDR